MPPDVPGNLFFWHLAEWHHLLFVQRAVVGDQLDRVQLGVCRLVINWRQHSSEPEIVDAEPLENLVLSA